MFLPSRGKGPQCYRCQEFGHIAHECTKLKKPQQQERAACPGTPDADERKRAVQGMSFEELREYFRHLKRLEDEDKVGTISLESELDSAICILEYRLSFSKDPVACSIYKFRISLLKQKIDKTHKKSVPSVVSPLSVSVNKYAYLVVEDVDTQCTMDCTDTSVSLVSPSVVFPSASATVPSQRVQEKGAT